MRKYVREDSEQFPVGIDYVIVNGTIVIDKGQHTGAKPGKVIHGPARKAPKPS